MDEALQAPKRQENKAADAASAKAQQRTHACWRMTFLHPVDHDKQLRKRSGRIDRALKNNVRRPRDTDEPLCAAEQAFIRMGGYGFGTR